MAAKDPKPTPEPEPETPDVPVVPDPDDDSPQGKFARGEITWDELQEATTEES